MFTREKAYIRLEADSNYNTDQTIQGLKSENETLREELMMVEKKFLRAQRDQDLSNQDYRKTRERDNRDNRKNVNDLSDHVTLENDRVKEILRRRIDQKIEDISQNSFNKDKDNKGYQNNSNNKYTSPDYESRENRRYEQNKFLLLPERGQNEEYVDGGRINTMTRSVHTPGGNDMGINRSPGGNKLLNSGNMNLSHHSGANNKNIL